MYQTQRGDIFYADLGLQNGEINPVIVIQNDVSNRFSPKLIVASITKRKEDLLPTHVSLEDAIFLPDHSIIVLDQITTIDRMRLKEYIGRIDQRSTNEVDVALSISVGLNKMYCR